MACCHESCSNALRSAGLRGDEDEVFMNVIHVIVLVTQHFINGEMLRSGEAERGGREVKGAGCYGVEDTGKKGV